MVLEYESQHLPNCHPNCPKSPSHVAVHMGVSENSVPLNPMVFMIIIPIKWLFHWEYTQHFQTNPYSSTMRIASRIILGHLFQMTPGRPHPDSAAPALREPTTSTSLETSGMTHCDCSSHGEPPNFRRIFEGGNQCWVV